MNEEHPPPERRLVQRTAKLFEAGRYPDKNLEVSPGQLDEMAGAFSRPVPVRVEHRQSPLRLGWLVKVWREGSSLLGRLAFTRKAWDLLQESGARAVSLGLDRDTLAIREVSIVRFPRVASARVFSDSALVLFTFELHSEDDEEESEAMSDGMRPAGDDAAGEAALAEARRQVSSLVESGKVAPAAAEFAVWLLSADDAATVSFSGGKVSPAEAFRRFLEAQPPVVLFSETAPAGSGRTCSVERPLLEAFGLKTDDVVRYGGGEES